MSKKKIGIIIGAVVLVAAAAAFVLWKFGTGAGHDSNDRVYVEKVSTIMGSAAGMQNRYSGLVQPQKTVNVNADSERTIKEFLVKEGDTVEEGTPLFVYNTEDIEMELEQTKLEIENTDLDISGYRSQIAELEKERNAASEDGKFEYTTQIQSIQAQIRQAEYDKSSKKLEIEKIQKKIDNSQVTSTTNGVIKTLNDPKNNDNSNTGGDNNATISIMVTGNYRVKGTLDEQTINMISPGANVIIRSRVDENQTWKGVVDNIDTGETAGSEDNDDMMSSSSSDGGESSATKYPFYISLDNADGLILGQHVYIELDQGQQEVKEGLWLYASYIVTENGSAESLNMDDSMISTEMEYGEEALFDTESSFDSGSDAAAAGALSGTEAFVWADDGKGRLTKKMVQLGEYDPMLDEYEILSGITEEDYIAWPMEGLYEGVKTVTNQDDVDYSSGLYNMDDTESLDGLGDDSWGSTEMMVNPEDFGTENMYPADITNMVDAADTEEVSE